VLTLIANNFINSEAKNPLLKSFEAMDKNGDGVLTREELIEGKPI